METSRSGSSARARREAADRGPRLADDGVLDRCAVADHASYECLGFTAGSAVADRHHRDPMRLDKGIQCGFRLGFISIRIDGTGIEHLTRSVDHRHFTAGAKARVDAENSLAAHRGLQQKRTQIGGKHTDRMRICHLGKLTARIALDRREEQPTIAVLACCDQVLDESAPHIGRIAQGQ